MKKFILVPITIFICLFLLGTTIKTEDSNSQTVVYAAERGIYTSTEKLEEPIEEETAEPVILSLEQEREPVPAGTSYEVFVTEILYSQAEIYYILFEESRLGFMPYATIFYEVAEKYGINPIYLIAKFGLESGWGTSHLFLTKNNVGGWRLNSGEYKTFESVEESIDFIASRIAERYQGWTLQEICVKYCTDDGYYNYIYGMMEMLNKEIEQYRGM